MRKPRSVQLKEKVKAAEKKVETVKKTQEQQAIERFKFEKQCINEVAGTPQGRVVFRVLERICCHNRSKVAADQVSKVIDEKGTTNNCMQENIYLNFRRLIRREHLIRIEFPAGEEKE